MNTKTGNTIVICFLMLFALVFSRPSTGYSKRVYDIPLVKNEDKKEKSLRAFQTILEVLKDPRCINCHPTGDRPRQGDDQHLHLFNVSRGESNNGGPVQKCNTCHHKENNNYSNVPGAPHWSLAPKSMGWFGLTDEEIAKRLTDPEQNGGRSPEDLVHHMKHDSLVLWGWDPGKGRTPVKVSFNEFEKALDEWLENGAHIPTEKADN
ncbi:hypothetical protein [Leptobacterium flavescens]|uniref:hypothetical protein n=1 Tax=Leptobacterium flavescens TaxID=472055 RepID=UPI001954F3F1|nr:hypothetical protein [Leptobacterium flavescens]